MSGPIFIVLMSLAVQTQQFFPDWLKQLEQKMCPQLLKQKLDSLTEAQRLQYTQDRSILVVARWL